MSNSPPNQIHAKTSLINEILLASMFSTSYVQVTPKNTPIASIPIIIALSETVGMFSILVLSDKLTSGWAARRLHKPAVFSQVEFDHNFSLSIHQWYLTPYL